MFAERVLFTNLKYDDNHTIDILASYRILHLNDKDQVDLGFFIIAIEFHKASCTYQRAFMKLVFNFPFTIR